MSLANHRTGFSWFLTICLVGGVLLAGLWVRLWTLNDESIWHDEGWSIRAIRGPFTTPDDNTPVVYYLFGHLLWKAGTGETPFAFRFGSVLLGLLTIAIALKIGWRWYGLAAGITLGLLVAFSPLLWEYAQEVRAYVAVPLLALFLLALADALLSRSSTRTIPHRLWAYLFLTELAGLYTHNLMVPVILWLNLAVGVAWVWRRDWQRLVVWAILHTLLAMAYLPWLLTQSPSGTPLNTVPAWNFTLVKQIWYSYFLPALPQVQATPNDTWLNLAGILVILASLLLLLTERSHCRWLLISHALLIPIFTTALLRAAHIDFHPRYFIAAVPGTLLLTVAAITALQRLTGQGTMMVGLGIVAIGGMLLAQDSLRTIHDTRIYQHDDFAALADYYATLPADAIILIPYNREPALQDYYAHHKNIRARFVNIPLHAPESRVLETLVQLAPPRHIEFLTWFQLPADVRGMYPCLLAGSSNTTAETQHFFGLSTQGFSLVTQPQFQAILVQASYQEVRLISAGWMAAGGTICVQTTWQLLQPLTELSVSARLLNPYGWPLARSDAAIRNREQVGTGNWQPGATGMSYHVLPLPAAAPDTAYTLELNIYNRQFASGLDVLSATGSGLGKYYRTDPVIHAAGPPLDETLTSSRLVGDSGDELIDSGTPLNLTLLLTPGTQSVTLSGDGWQLEQSVPPIARPQLSWHVFQVPPAATGTAHLMVDNTVIATYTIRAVEHLFVEPSYATPVNAEFADAGTLIGVTMKQTTVSPDHPPEITLIWRARGATTLAYTVFVQLLDSTGRVLAQSDSPPAANQRSTTGWVAGEYIIDDHTLTFGVDDYQGAAYLIAGFYNPTTFDRVPSSNGADHVRLPLEVSVTK